MLIIWGIFWGAALGSFWPGYGDASTYIGGILGMLAGVTLRFAIKKQVAEQQEDLRVLLAKAVPADKVQPVNAGAGAAPEGALAGVPVATSTSATEGFAAAAAAAMARNQAARAASAVQPSAAQAAEALDDQEFWKDELSRADASLAASTARPNAAVGATATTTPTKTKAPVALAKPNAIELALKAAQDWFLGGNTIVRGGLVILFIGLSFLARYAAAASLLPPELRLAVIGAVGIALLAIGFKKRTDKPGFALALQGAGVAVMYLTVFAAFKLYDMLPPLLAFGFMIVVCALSCALALLQNSRALAVAAFAGGFAVPILLSTGQGNHVGLFSYYVVLNLAILYIAHKRSWRILNVLGFLATFGVATAWGALKFAPEQYASTQPFLIGFALIYIATAILYARNTPTKLGNAVDSTLVFGTPLIAFGLQAGLTRQFELGTAFSALGFGAVYLVLATLLSRRDQGEKSGYRLLIECFIALGVGFATLAVPLALDAQWTSAVWALEGAAAFWVGMRQARWMPRAFGLLLQAVAAVAFINGVGSNISALPLLNPAFMGAMLIAVPALLIAWWLRQSLPHSGSSWANAYAAVEGQLSKPLYLYGFVWWCAALLLEISRSTPAKEMAVSYLPVFAQSTQALLGMLAVLLSMRASQYFGIAKNWAVATWPSRASLAMMLVTLISLWDIGSRVLHTPGWIVWPLALALHYWMLRINDSSHVASHDANAAPAVSISSVVNQINHVMHVGGVWLITLLLADVLWFWIGQGDLWRTAWASVVVLISGIGVLMALSLWAGRANQQSAAAQFSWPLNPHAAAYYWVAAIPLAVLVFAGAFVVSVSSAGRTEPLPYIPLFNPTDLTIALALGALVFWRRAVTSAVPMPAGAAALGSKRAWVALAALAFIAINTVWLRVAHHFFGVDWTVSSLFNSFVVQTGYAILWTLLALTMMLVAGRRKLRPLWLVGAGLLGVVVVKLLLIDLSNAGGAERIIAFIAVGALMLVVGYFAPLPPKTTAGPIPDALPDALPDATPKTANNPTPVNEA
jgi:uncharacterized membrane protein